MVEAIHGDGTNATSVPLIRQKLQPSRLPVPLHSSAHLPCIELDKEDAAFRANDYSNLGLMPNAEVMGPWWAGCVEQKVKMVAQIQKKTSMIAGRPTVAIKFLLQPHEAKGKSFHFSRQFGSRRWLQMQVPDMNSYKFSHRSAVRDAIKGTLSKGFILLGRVFRPVCYKDGTLRLVETNENIDRSPLASMGDDRRLSFFDLVNWFNPVAANQAQV